MKTQSNRIALVAWAVVAVLCHVCCAPLVTAADATPAEVRRKLDEARKLIDDGRPAKAKPILAAAAADLAALAELERVPSGVRPLIDACSELKDDLDLEGIDVAGIEIPQLKSSRPAPAKTAGPAAKPAARAMPGISFTQQVAPILVTHCGGCHVTGRKGGFQMASYEALMKTGLVQRGVGDASRIVEVIATGDMPRGGGRVSPQEMMTLVTWINAGATFDGPDPAAPLGRPAGAAPAAADASAMNAMPVALKPGDVSFAFDIAPVLIKNCVGCHDDDQPEARLSMTTFARFSRGGESGAAFVAGRAADSLLVRKIKGSSGIEGQRMPIGKPPLTPEVIALVEKWIDQGARLDVLGPTARINDVAAAGRSRSLSHEDLKTQRFTAAEKLWQRTLPDEPPAKVTIGDIAVISNLSKSRLDEAAGSIEKAAAGVQEQLVDGAGPALKGGVACFLFAKAYDYSNFRESISGEERPKGLVGDVGVSGDVVYGAWIAPASTEEGADDDVAALAAEQIAAAALLGRGAPHWFARGAGRAIATKVVPKAGVVKAWRQEAADAVGRLASPEDFFGGHSGPVVQAAVGGGFMSTLAASPAKIRSVVERIDGGAAFDAAFAEVFKGSPPTLFVAWAAQEARKPAGKR